MERAFDTAMVAGQAVIVRVQHVDSGLENADAAQVPGGIDQFIKESLLELALRVNFVFIAGQEKFELFTVFWCDQQLLGGKAMFAGVLSAAGFAFFSTRAGAGLRVGLIGLNSQFGRHVDADPFGPTIAGEVGRSGVYFL